MMVLFKNGIGRSFRSDEVIYFQNSMRGIYLKGMIMIGVKKRID